MAIRSRAFRAQLLCSVPLILICAGPVAAQEQDGFFQMLGRIILGAGTAKVAIETPQAVSTIEAEELGWYLERWPVWLAVIFTGIGTLIHIKEPRTDPKGI